MSDTARDLLRTTATLVNTRLPEDVRPLTDTQLLGFIKLAFRDVVRELAEKGHLNLRIEYDFSGATTIPAGTRTLNAASSPPLPGYVLQVIRAWEKPAGTANWQPMTQALDHLPMNASQSTAMGWWEWRDNALRLSPAQSAVDLRIHAFTRLTEPAMPLDVVGLPDIVNAVAYAAAAMALGGNTFLETKSRAAIQGVANINAHQKQAQPVRRRRFRRGIRMGRY